MTALICIITEHPSLAPSWSRSLAPHAEAVHFSSPQALLATKASSPFVCLISARFFASPPLDLLRSPLAMHLKNTFSCPFFLNWPGSLQLIKKHPYIDGSIALHYGISFAALQTKIKRLYKKHPQAGDFSAPASKKLRCQQLFHHMAQQAGREHRRILERFAGDPQEQGIAFLEAIYVRLSTQGSCVPAGCASSYIHSSPLLALKILKEIFAQTEK